MDLQALIEAKAAAIGKIDALLAKPDMSADELTQHDALVAEVEGLNAKIARGKAQAERQKQAEAEAASLAGVGRRSAADKPGEVHRITTHQSSLDDPKKGFKTPREYLSAIMDAGNGLKIDDRLKPLRQAAVGSDEHQTGDNNYGGFLVPEGFSPDFLQISADSDPMAGRVRNVPMDNVTVKFQARVDKDHSSSVSGGLTVSRRAETTAAAASRMQTEQVTLTAYSLFGLAYASEELLTDSPRSFAAMIASGFSEEFSAKIVDERLNGTGVGEFLGINNSPALISVTKETGQAADTIVYENIIKMRSRCWGYQNAVWLANHDCLPQLMLLNQSIGTGGVPVWQPSAGMDHPDMLLGRPLIFTEYTNTVGDAGDIICANFMEYLEGTYQPLQSAESMHVRFINHERTFKFWLRNAGAPWWKSPLTPAKSAVTLSPFVRLAAR